MVMFKQSQIVNSTIISLRTTTNERSQWMRMRATESTGIKGNEVEGQTIVVKTWLMRVERGMRFPMNENGMT